MQSYNFLHYLQINILLLLSINNLVIFVQQMPWLLFTFNFNTNYFSKNSLMPS